MAKTNIPKLVIQFTPPVLGVYDFTFNRGLEAPTSQYLTYFGIDIDQPFKKITIFNLRDGANPAADAYVCIENDATDSIIVSPATTEGVYKLPSGGAIELAFDAVIERLRIYGDTTSKFTIEAVNRWELA